jgi:hypothetical protein
MTRGVFNSINEKGAAADRIRAAIGLPGSSRRDHAFATAARIGGERDEFVRLPGLRAEKCTHIETGRFRFAQKNPAPIKMYPRLGGEVG